LRTFCAQWRDKGGWFARFIGSLLAAIVALPASAQSPGFAADQVVLPFRCQVAQGRIVLVPRPDQVHTILGGHRSHAHTACAPGQPDRCRTWTIHKFDLACGNARVPWMSVVAAANERRPGTLQIDNGRLLMQLVPSARTSQRTFDSGWYAFPPGYAPAIGVQARFPSLPAATPTVVADRTVRTELPRTSTIVAGTGATSPGRTAADATASQPLSAAPAAAADGWLTVVERELQTRRPSISLDRALGVLGLLAMVWLGLVVARRARSTDPAKEASSVTASGTTAAMEPNEDEAAMCAALIARVVNLHRAARDALPGVPSASLRALLADDLDRVQTALLAPELTQQIADGQWTAARLKVTAALADLERVGRTIAGVLETSRLDVGPASAPPPAPQPETVADAFAILGLNPHASRSIVKKVVDGLRQSWHPDHAHDERDRAAREARMKQINAAWDLIRADLPETGRPAA
jgi:hypothetical protein